MSNLIVGFVESINDDLETNELTEYVIENGYIGIDTQKVNGYDNLYESKQLLHDDIKNIKLHFNEACFEHVISTRCIGRETNDIDDLIDLVSPYGNMELFCVLQSNLPIIIQKACLYFERIEIELLNYYGDDPEETELADFSVRMINKLEA